MFKINNITYPRKEYIENNKNLIFNIFIFVSILLLLLLFEFKNFNNLDIILYTISVLNVILGWYSCIFYWCPNTLLFDHYGFVVMLFLILFSSNKWLIIYYINLAIIILLGWILNNGNCMFDTISWDLEINGIKWDINKNQWSERILLGILFIIYPLKINSLNYKNF